MVNRVDWFMLCIGHGLRLQVRGRHATLSLSKFFLLDPINGRRVRKWKSLSLPTSTNPYQMAQLCDLPNELLLMIVEYLVSCRDISSLAQANRRFACLFFDHLFNTWWRKLSNSPDPAVKTRLHTLQPRIGALGLFCHAAKHNSANIIQWLIFNTDCLDFKGFMTIESRIQDTTSRQDALTFLHFALLADAPRVAAHLMKHGADIDQVAGNYPDLTPLCLTIAQPRTSSQKNLDVALRIASSYALPRTARVLLSRAANPASTSYGISSLHIAVTRRLPWKKFGYVQHQLHSKWLFEDELPQAWGRMITETVSELLEFGAPVELSTVTTRAHECTHMCWRSLDCDHRGQTALHLACGSGIKEIVSLLLEHGADPSATNGYGYTPLYYALVQGHKEIAQKLLEVLGAENVNPIVFMPQLSTALHVAARYAFSDMVGDILQRGANPDVGDIDGKTPLHEVLGQTQATREKDVVESLGCLDRFGADPDIESYPQSPSAMATMHPFKGVRDMFRPVGEESSIAVSTDCYVPHDGVDSSGRRLSNWSEGAIRPMYTSNRYRAMPSTLSLDMDDKHEFPNLVTTTPGDKPATTHGGWTPERTRFLSQRLPLSSRQQFPSIAGPTAASSTSGSELWPPTPGTTGDTKVGGLVGSKGQNEQKDEDIKQRGTGKRVKKWKPLQL